MVDNSVKITIFGDFDVSKSKKSVQEGIDRIERGLKGLDLDNILTGVGQGIGRALTDRILGLSDALGEFAQSSVTAAASFETLQFTLQGVGVQNIPEILSRVKETSDRLGLSFIDTAKAFTGFSTAVKGTVLEGQSLQIFEQLTAGFKGLGASSDEASRAFVAVTQTLAKGTFAAEEIRGQLAEAVPASLPILANAAGLSIQDFNRKLSENGTAIGDVNKIIPIFAQSLSDLTRQTRLFQQNSLETAIRQAANAFTIFQIAVGESLDPVVRLGASLAQLGLPAVAEGIDVLTNNLGGLATVITAISVFKGFAFLGEGVGLAIIFTKLAAVLPVVATGLVAVAAATQGLKAAFAVFGDVSGDIKAIRDESDRLVTAITGVAEQSGPLAQNFRDISGISADYATNYRNAIAASEQFNESLLKQRNLQVENNDVFGSFGTLVQEIFNKVNRLFKGTEAAEATKEFKALSDTVKNLSQISDGLDKAITPDGLTDFANAVQAVKKQIADTNAGLADLTSRGETTSQEFIDLRKQSAELKKELANIPKDVLGVDLDEAKQSLATAEATISLLSKQKTLSQDQERLLESAKTSRDEINKSLEVFNGLQKQVTIETKSAAQAEREAELAAKAAKEAKREQLELEKQAAAAAREAAALERERLAAIREVFAVKAQQVQLEIAAVNQQQSIAESLGRAELNNLKTTVQLAVAQAKLSGQKVSANQEARIAAAIAQRELEVTLELAVAEAERANLTAQLAVNEAELALEKEKQLGSDQKIIDLAQRRIDLAKQQAQAIAAGGALDVDTAEKKLELQKAQTELAERERNATKEASNTANNIVPTRTGTTGGVGGGGLGIGLGVGGTSALSTREGSTKEATREGVALGQEPLLRQVQELLGVQKENLQALQNLPGNLREAEAFQGTDFDAFLERFPALAERGGFNIPQGGLAPPEEVIDLPQAGRRSAIAGPGAPVLPLSGPESELNAPITLNLTVNGQVDSSTAGLVEAAGRQAALEFAQAARRLAQ